MALDAASARLRIAPVIERARLLREQVARDLPTHDGLAGAAALLVGAAEDAERVTARLRRPWSLHRLPVLFLALALGTLGATLYWQLFHVTTLTLAVPERDAGALRQRLQASRVAVRLVEVTGSREGLAALAEGTADLAFVQGGMAIPAELERLESPAREVVLFLLREGVAGPAQVQAALTSVEGEGSHSVGQAFFAAWGTPVRWVHDWTRLTGEAGYRVPAEVQAVLVVKDLDDERTLQAVARLQAQGFRLASPRLGARAGRLDWLRPHQVPAGELILEPPFPPAPVETYSVATYLVARRGLTPKLLAQAAEVIEGHPASIVERRFKLSSAEASEVFQGVEAVLAIGVDLGLAFLALLGLDVIAYRRRFHQLNSLVSVISLLQSTKDVLDVPAEARPEQLRYLGLCSDMLSLISAVAGYYTQENSSLLFNNLSEVVHQRCDGLKLNIQLKLLHALAPAIR